MQICPFLSLGALFAIYPFRQGFRNKGNILSKKDTFNKELKKLIKAPECTCDPNQCRCSSIEKRRRNFVEYLEREGIPFKLITMHSWRKGSASTAASGSTMAPPIIAICLRANWKLPGSLNRYLFLEQAGDQFVGRVCAGLPIMSPRFCVLPPRWRPNLSAEDQLFVDQMYRATYPNDNLWGHQMIPICRHLFANLCYHQEFLSALPDEHMWHMTYLGRNPEDFRRLKSLVELKFDGDDPTCM